MATNSNEGAKVVGAGIGGLLGGVLGALLGGGPIGALIGAALSSYAGHEFVAEAGKAR
jgi:hypothetical protein